MAQEIDNRFSKFGTVSFTGLTRVNDFVDYLEKGKVEGTKCKKCGTRYFPPRADCAKCLVSDMEWFEVEGKGKLLTFSTLTFAPTGFGQDVPYTLACVDYGDYRVFGRMDKSVPVNDMAVGMEVKTVVNKLENDQLNFVFQKV